MWRLASSPVSFLERVLVLAFWIARVWQRQSQPQLLIPTQRFHGNGGARRHSVTKLRKPSVGLGANHHPM